MTDTPTPADLGPEPATEPPAEPQETTIEPTATADTPEPAEPATEPVSEPQSDDASPNREAAKWRTKLRETEAERDTLRSQLEAAHRALIETRVSSRLVDPADYWLHGGQIVVSEDGLTLDAAAIDAHVSGILESRPHLTARRAPAPNPAQGTSGAGATKGDGPTWGDVFAR